MLEAIENKIRNCKRCELWKTRDFSVTGSGNKKSKIMFIGESPSEEDDKYGTAFLDESGTMFGELLKHIGLERTDVYVTNIIKCYQPKYIKKAEEKKAKAVNICSYWLDAEIYTINPEIIVTFGNFATNYIFEKFGLRDKIKGIGLIKGKVFCSRGIYIIPLYHPAFITHVPSKLNECKRDFEVLIASENFADICEE